jgi:hypothetical protein
MFSAVHPTTDIAKILRHVRFVPQPDSCSAAKEPLLDHRVTERADRHRRHIDAGSPGGPASDVGRSANNAVIPGQMPDVSIGPRKSSKEARRHN